MYGVVFVDSRSYMMRIVLVCYLCPFHASFLCVFSSMRARYMAGLFFGADGARGLIVMGGCA
jgi:hypothetical protein